MASGKLYYFKWFPKDFDSDENVRMMDDTDLGFYLRCLNHAWMNGGSIPADQQELARALKAPKAYLRKRWERVGKCFHPMESDPSRLINPRLHKEWLHAKDKSESSTNAVRTRYGRTYVRSQNVLPRAYGSDSNSASGEGAGRGDPWPGSGWDGPEAFEIWWVKLVAYHPNRNYNSLARDKALELLLMGKLKRQEFESGYREIRKAGGDAWTEKNGRFAPNLFNIFEDMLWFYKSAEAPESKLETATELRARQEREHADEERQRALRLGKSA